MPVVISTNLAAITAQKHAALNMAATTKTVERLSSGYKINRAGDDAAGACVSSYLKGQIKGLARAADNIQDGINMLNIADGSYEVIADFLQRMRELAILAANGTSHRPAITLEMDALRNEIDRIATTTRFNGISILMPLGGIPIRLQIGANANNNNFLDISNAIGDTRASTGTGLFISIAPSVAITSSATARAFVNTLDQSLLRLNTRRSILGAMLAGLQNASRSAAISEENNTAAIGRIRDADLSLESSSYIRSSIALQATNMVLAQANQTPNLALQLLTF